MRHTTDPSDVELRSLARGLGLVHDPGPQLLRSVLDPTSEAIHREAALLQLMGLVRTGPDSTERLQLLFEWVSGLPEGASLLHALRGSLPVRAPAEPAPGTPPGDPSPTSAATPSPTSAATPSPTSAATPAATPAVAPDATPVVTKGERRTRALTRRIDALRAEQAAAVHRIADLERLAARYRTEADRLRADLISAEKELAELTARLAGFGERTPDEVAREAAARLARADDEAAAARRRAEQLVWAAEEKVQAATHRAGELLDEARTSAAEILAAADREADARLAGAATRARELISLLEGADLSGARAEAGPLVAAARAEAVSIVNAAREDADTILRNARAEAAQVTAAPSAPGPRTWADVLADDRAAPGFRFSPPPAPALTTVGSGYDIVQVDELVRWAELHRDDPDVTHIPGTLLPSRGLAQPGYRVTEVETYLTQLRRALPADRTTEEQ